MNFRTTVVLLIVLLVVLLLSFFLGRVGEEDNAGTARLIDAEKWLLITPKFEDLKKIELKIKDKDRIVFEKSDDGKWMITEPVRARAISWEVLDLISAFEDAKKLETLTPGRGKDKDITLSDLGLSEPTIVVSFVDKKRTATVLVGKNVVASDNTYVKFKDDERVYIVDKNLRKKIKQNLAEYRDKRIWEIKKDKIREVIYAFNDRKYVFEKKDGKFYLVEPFHGKADDSEFSERLDYISWLDADEFIDDKPVSLVPYGLDKPTWAITIVEVDEISPTTTQPTSREAKDKGDSRGKDERTKVKKYTLLVGRSSELVSDRYYAKLSDTPSVFTIRKSDLENILPDERTYCLDTRLLDIDNKSRIKKVVFRTEDKDFSIESKDSSAWVVVMADGKKYPAEKEVVDSLFERLFDLKAEQIITDTSMLGDTHFLAEIYTEDRCEPIIIRVGTSSGSGIYRFVNRGKDEYLLAIKNEELSPIISVDPLHLYERRLMQFDIDDVVSISIAQPGRRYYIKREDKDLPWIVEEPIKGLADKDNIIKLLSGLSLLKADRFVKALPSSAETNKISITIKAKKKVRLMKVDNRGEGQGKVSSSHPTTQSTMAAQESFEFIEKSYSVDLVLNGRNVYAIVGPNKLPAVVPSNIFDLAAGEFVDTRIYRSLDIDSITMLRILQGSRESFSLVKEKSSWVFPEDPIIQIDGEKVKEYLRTIKDLKAEKIVDFSKDRLLEYGFKNSILAIELKEKDKLIKIKAASKGNNYYIFASDPGWILKVDKATLNMLNKDIRDFVR